MQRRIRWIKVGGSIAAALAVLAFLGVWLARPDHGLSAAEFRLCAAEVMAKGAEAASDVKTIHIQARMRTLPSGNFSEVGKDYDMVSIDLWKQFDENDGPGKWRIEKPGLVIVMDGNSTVLLAKALNRYSRIPKPTRDPYDTTWFQRIAAVDANIADELRSALANGWDLKLSHSTTGAATATTTVIVNARSEAGEYEYLRNRSIDNLDSVRTYHFDQESGRLKGLEVHFRDALVFEITKTEYNQTIDPEVFALELPRDAIPFESKQPEILPDNEKYARMTPAEAARAFFESMASGNWKECAKFCLEPPDDRFMQTYGGLTVLQIGEAFIPEDYAGWYVPYEIRLKSGEVKKFNLALRNNNRAKRFIFDGGL